MPISLVWSQDQYSPERVQSFPGHLGCIWSCIVMTIIGEGASCFTASHSCELSSFNGLPEPKSSCWHALVCLLTKSVFLCNSVLLESILTSRFIIAHASQTLVASPSHYLYVGWVWQVQNPGMHGARLGKGKIHGAGKKVCKSTDPQTKGLLIWVWSSGMVSN